ncbi:MAG: WYL domain-containing protein [Bacteriovoracaceae bacterium]|nr:WYL domain-containing protein [Bacteriovoracaceae bacterium]
MVEDSPIFNDGFWKILKYLEDIEGQKDAREVINDLDIEEKDLIEALTFLGHFDVGISLEMEGVKPVIVREDKRPIVFKLSFCEWMALQAHFPLFDKHKDKEFHKTLSKRLSVIESENEGSSFFEAMESWKLLKSATASCSEAQGEIVEEIEKSFHAKLILDIKLNKGTLLELYPHRIVYFDGQLNLIGEETGDRCLVYFPISDIQSLDSKMNTGYLPNFSRLEIHDFISAIRTVSGSEERLVMKITDIDDLNLDEAHHFITNPYVTSNSKGEVIWAANVEACDNFFEWLYSIENFVEVLDPLTIKEDFDEFKALKEVKKFKKAG